MDLFSSTDGATPEPALEPVVVVVENMQEDAVHSTDDHVYVPDSENEVENTWGQAYEWNSEDSSKNIIIPETPCDELHEKGSEGTHYAKIQLQLRGTQFKVGISPDPSSSAEFCAQLVYNESSHVDGSHSVTSPYLHCRARASCIQLRVRYPRVCKCITSKAQII